MAFEERSPRAPLLVLPNGASLPAEVRALKRVGFSGAIALHDALGVPSRAGGATSATAAAADPADASAQEGMLERRQALADTFVRNMRGDGAAAAAKAAAAEEDDEDDEDDGFEDAMGETSELGVPLLVTTELAARGVDFKAMCAAASPMPMATTTLALPARHLPSPPPPPPTPHSLVTLHTHRRPKCCRRATPPRRRLAAASLPHPPLHGLAQ